MNAKESFDLKNVLFVVVKGCDDLGLLKKWSQKEGGKFVSISSIDEHTKHWNICAKIKTPILVVNYPIEEHLDVETVSYFLEKAISETRPIYYAPRPNSLLDVETPALIASRFPDPIRLSYFHRAKLLVKGIVSLFPEGSIKNRLVKRLAKLSKHLNKTNSQANKVGGNSKQACTPRIIKRPNISWLEFDPGKEVQKRDLLDRTKHFFPHPQSIHVAILNKCNLKCVMCNYHSPKYKEGHTSGYFDAEKALSLEDFREIARYAGERNIHIQFGQIEETLLHPHIFDFFRIAQESGVSSIHLTTNGTLLSKSKAEQLASSGVTSVMFSIDASTPEKYKEIRGASLDKLERNIAYFLPLAKKQGINVMTSFIRQPQSRGQKEGFINKWMEIGVDEVTTYVLTEHDVLTGDLIRSEELYEKGERYPCASPWRQLVVMPEGEVSLCCKTMMDIGWRGVVSTGSIKENGLEEIWTGDRYRRVREELLANKFKEFPVCQKCPIWSASTTLLEESTNYTRSYNETMETYRFK
tara:strand:- start:88 stop:1662 length:1575 start_codon:yes stop_codon:yes gene_type:complete